MNSKKNKDSQINSTGVKNINIGGEISGNIIIGNSNVVTNANNTSEGDEINLENFFQDKRKLIDLVDILRSRLTDRDFSALCFEIGVDYDKFTSGPKGDRIIELISYLDRRMELSKLLVVLKKTRPDIIVALSRAG